MLDPYSRPGLTVDQEPPGSFRIHTTPRELPPHLLWSAFTFTTVRNPWARLVSFYEWARARGQMRARFHRWIEQRGPNAPTVVCPPFDELASVDVVVRLEHITEDLPEVLAHAGLPELPIEHVNATEHPSYRDYYDNRTRELVGMLYELDVDAFGYSF